MTNTGESFPQPTTPDATPGIIDHMPTAEELASSRMDPRLANNMTRGALQAMAEGATEDSPTLNAMYPSSERPATETAPVQPVAEIVAADAAEPRVVPEHERPVSRRELKELREQILLQDFADFAEAILDAHLTGNDPEQAVSNYVDSFLQKHAQMLSPETTAILAEKRVELVRKISRRGE